jgi:hypothetical protein
MLAPHPKNRGQHDRNRSVYLRLICVNIVPAFWNRLAGRNVRLQRGKLCEGHGYQVDRFVMS